MDGPWTSHSTPQTITWPLCQEAAGTEVGCIVRGKKSLYLGIIGSLNMSHIRQ
jgi:hypothetical protein